MLGKKKISGGVLLVLAIAFIIIANQMGFIKLGAIVPIDTSKIYLDPVFGELKCDLGDPRSISIPVNIVGGVSGVVDNFETTDLLASSCIEEVGDYGCDYSVINHQQNYCALDNVWMRTRDKTTGKCLSGTNTGVIKSTVDECGDTVILYGSGATAVAASQHISANTEVKFYSLCNFLVTKNIRPYVLTYTRGLGGSYVWNSEGCRVVKIGAEGLAQQVETASVCVKDTTVGGYCKAYKGQLAPTESVSFLESYVMSVIDFAPTLNNQQVCCVLGSIYSIGDITLASGSTFKICDTDPTARLGSYGIGGTYPCCSGMTDGTKICKNWKWEDLSSTNYPCQVHSQCYVGMFSGGWSTDPSDTTYKTVLRGACINNLCDYDYEKMKVECTSNGQCSGSTPMCDVGNTWKCIASIGGIIPVNPTREICNDGIDNDGNGLIDINDPTCQGWNFNLDSLMNWLKKSLGLDWLANLLKIPADILTWIVLVIIVFFVFWLLSKMGGGGRRNGGGGGQYIYAPVIRG